MTFQTANIQTPGIIQKDNYLPTFSDNYCPPFLDTLAQLPRSPLTEPKKDDGIIRLKKRAKSKYFTGRRSLALIDIKSPLKKYYWNAFYCNHTLVQVENSVTAKYCNTRICNNCNRIRTAKMINGYKHPLAELDDKQFVTLTLPNDKAQGLSETLSSMQLSLRNIFKKLQLRKVQYGGVRKTEITYNAVRNDYHPHLHIIINGRENASYIVKEWLARYPGAAPYCQDIRPVDDFSMMELFKYSTKVVSTGINGTAGIYVRAVDTIIRALYRKRIIQPFGSIRKQVSEDVEEIDKQAYPGIPEYDCIEWNWQESDWMNKYGELLTGYVPSEAIQRVNIINSG